MSKRTRKPAPKLAQVLQLPTVLTRITLAKTRLEALALEIEMGAPGERYEELEAAYMAAKAELLIPGHETFANEHGYYGKIWAIMAWKGLGELAERRPAAPSDAKLVDLAAFRARRAS